MKRGAYQPVIRDGHQVNLPKLSRIGKLQKQVLIDVPNRTSTKSETIQ